ncbi:MAG: MBL fold metallo-hydrolase [Patescibacteria group bacterium]|nr:MBL fold metallo-hydrolase [Patescibacteria group bacterium]
MKKFKLTIVGSGAMMPTKKRHPSCYLLEIGERKILLDIGHTSLARLVEMGIDLNSIDILFISHFHTDHFADALPLVHALWVDGIRRFGGKYKNLTIIGPKSIKKRWEKLKEVFWVEPEEHYPLKFLEGTRKISIDGIKIELFEVTHVPYYQSIGIKVNFQKKIFVYTGDIGGEHSAKKLKQKARNADLLLIEAGYLNPTPNHFTIDQIAQIVKEAEVKKAIATHLRDAYLPALKEKIKGQQKIILAKDLMKISI